MKTKVVAFFLFSLLCLSVFYFSHSRMEGREAMLSLIDIEKMAHAEDINYQVPGKINDPKTCTMEVWISGGLDGSEGSVNGHYKKVQGIKNVCTEGTGTCDPYNCHQRVS